MRIGALKCRPALTTVSTLVARFGGHFVTVPRCALVDQSPTKPKRRQAGHTGTMTWTLRLAALAFALIALGAGGLQLWAYLSTGFVRHLVLGLFAASVGVCVAFAAVRWAP